MIQLTILSGKKAGTRAVARHFPFRIGRAPGNGLQLEDDGVWDQHLSLELQPASGFHGIAAPQALVTVNGAPLSAAPLRNGDTFGYKMDVGLARTHLHRSAAEIAALLRHPLTRWSTS
jgi:hypothetical protein